MKAAIRKHWGRVAALGCLICGADAEIAHCHGGSIVERMQEPKAKGKKLERMDWLVLPLCPHCHRLDFFSLDQNVEVWEAQNGSQAYHIDRLCERFDLDLWELAKRGRK